MNCEFAWNEKLSSARRTQERLASARFQPSFTTIMECKLNLTVCEFLRQFTLIDSIVIGLGVLPPEAG
jgi:hypothetical protein